MEVGQLEDRSCAIKDPEIPLKLCVVENIASDWMLWRAVCKKSATMFEDQQVDSLKQKIQKRKTVQPLQMGYVCDICGRSCGAQIGLYRHRQSHD